MENLDPLAMSFFTTVGLAIGLVVIFYLIARYEWFAIVSFVFIALVMFIAAWSRVYCMSVPSC